MVQVHYNGKLVTEYPCDTEEEAKQLALQVYDSLEGFTFTKTEEE